MTSGHSVRKLDELEKVINECNGDKVTFVMFDNSQGSHDIDSWLRFIKEMPGEHYGTYAFNLYSMFMDKDTYAPWGLYCEIYTPNGDCILSTKDNRKVYDVLKTLK